MLEEYFHKPANGEIELDEDLQILASDLHLSFGATSKDGGIVKALSGANLVVRKGEQLFIHGPSGAGKSTLLYVLAGLERPDHGDVIIDGDSIYDMPTDMAARMRNERMGFIFQNYSLLPELTALENVSLPRMLAGSSDRDYARELLHIVGLEQRIHHLPSQLSGGEQQRAAIARALVNSPSIIFADEPTGNLDSRNGEEIMSLLLGVSNEQKCALLVVTHDRSLASIGSRVVNLIDGRVV